MAGKLVPFRSAETVVGLEFAGNAVSVIATDEYQHRQILITLTYFKGEWLLTRNADIVSIAETKKVQE